MNQYHIQLVKKNLLTMLKNRNIDISNIIESQNNIMIPNVIMIKFLIKKTIKPIDVKNELEKINEYEIDNVQFPQLILIFNTKPNNSILKIIKQYKIKYEIQIFLKHELLIDKINHVLVPKHVLINDEEEIKLILEKFKLPSINKLPFILKTDPIVKYYNAKVGNIFKIIRNSITSGEYITYRCVY